MPGLVECVPNFSEGRRREVIDAIAGRVQSTAGVHLLDRTSDSDHNRSVLTFAGRAQAVAAAMEGAVEEAIARIDMNGHAGQHPRIGAVDVIPFVPLAGTTMDEAIELARGFGRHIAERFGLPVFLYAKAAQRSDREVLADIRRPQYEGLRDVIGEPGNAPDFGPARLHPTAGAVAVGARPFLIAYNINLESRDLELAKSIARRVRERSGGLPRVQALGLDLAELGCVQVSMNLLDYSITPMWRVWETVTELAREEGVAARESELIGLCPLAALTAVGDHASVPEGVTVEERITRAAAWLKVRDFEPTMALELRMALEVTTDRPGLLVHNASEVATLAGGLRRGAAQADIGLLMAQSGRADDAPAVAAYQGRIVAVGRLPEVEARLVGLGVAEGAIERMNAHGGTVTPGLIDPHTHLLFGGTRHAEVALRQRGHSYLEILAAGGGILQTVRMTRDATDDALLDHGRRWLREMLSHGVTTAEVKSGYGLDTATELRLLALYGQLAEEGPVELVPTYLGAHAIAPEFRDRPDAARQYIDSVINEQLPAVAEQGIARSCDVFCERGVFSASDSRRLLTRAAELGLAARLHADELAPSGGAELAAEVGALSADHLGAISDEGIAALAAAAERGRPVVATLLPMTSFYLEEPGYAPARRLIEAGIPVALGTDFNPGTSPAPNAQLAMSFAIHRLRLSAAEALAALTINAAAALGMADSHGSLEPGKHADLVVWQPDSHTLLPYWLGANLVQTVIKRGRVVFQSPNT